MDDCAARLATYYPANVKTMGIAESAPDMLKEDARQESARAASGPGELPSPPGRRGSLKRIRLRQESCYPGFYYRMDCNRADDANRKCGYDRETNAWTLFKRKHVDLADKAVYYKSGANKVPERPRREAGAPQGARAFLLLPGASCAEHAKRAAESGLRHGRSRLRQPRDCCRTDILRFQRRLGLTPPPSSGRLQGLVPDGLGRVPGGKLKTDNRGACLRRVGACGWGIDADRPAVCRYAPNRAFGLTCEGARPSRRSARSDRRDAPPGPRAELEHRIAEYRTERGGEEYDARNRGFRRLILKKNPASRSVRRPWRASGAASWHPRISTASAGLS